MAMGGDGDDAELLRALAEYGGPTGVAGFAGAGFEATAGVDVAAAPGSAELCRVWRTVRPIVSRILSFLRAIPFIGASLARALSTLGTILDLVCRGGGTADLCRRWRGGLRTILVRIAGIVGAIPEDQFDHGFGVVEVDDVAHEFTILVEEDVAPRIRSSPGWTVVGAFSNPPIAPFGPPTDS